MSKPAPQPIAEEVFYAQAMERFDTQETAARLLCNEAFKVGDTETVWVCQATLKQLERDRANMRKPRPGHFYTPPA